MSKKNNKSKDTYLRGREVNAVYIDDPEVLFLCDWEACDIGIDCLGCNHTTDISHAKNFEKVAEGRYVEKEEKYKDEDLVNHPSHYTQDDVETIDKMVIIFGAEYTAIHCLATCFKYISRYKFKNDPELDLEKALWYAKKAYFLANPDEPYSDQFVGIRDYEFSDFGKTFKYREFYIEEAKRDVFLIGSNLSDQQDMIHLIKHIEYALFLDTPGVKPDARVSDSQ